MPAAAHVDVTRDGTLHGVCGCFVTTLADGVLMGNVPGESGTTNFAQAFFPIESPVAVRAGDHVAIRLETHDGLAARWQVEVTRRDSRSPGSTTRRCTPKRCRCRRSASSRTTIARR